MERFWTKTEVSVGLKIHYSLLNYWLNKFETPLGVRAGAYTVFSRSDVALIIEWVGSKRRINPNARRDLLGEE